MRTAATESCALCRHVATIAEWSPLPDWLTVAECPCSGYFVRKAVWTFRLPHLTDAERQNLTFRVRSLRVKKREAWVSTADRTVTGPLVVESDRPMLAGEDRPDPAASPPTAPARSSTGRGERAIRPALTLAGPGPGAPQFLADGMFDA